MPMFASFAQQQRPMAESAVKAPNAVSSWQFISTAFGPSIPAGWQLVGMEGVIYQGNSVIGGGVSLQPVHTTDCRMAYPNQLNSERIRKAPLPATVGAGERKNWHDSTSTSSLNTKSNRRRFSVFVRPPESDKSQNRHQIY